MKKIPTIFKRNPNNRSLVIDEKNPVCEWVFDGEGVATRKFDGTCCMIQGSQLYKRREFKNGNSKPDGFIEVDYDETTKKSFGWIPVDFELKENIYHKEGFYYTLGVLGNLRDGTYELVGPKIQGNPENYEHHFLVNHTSSEIIDVGKVNFGNLQLILFQKDIEGIVFQHPDGRMAKIKKRDFGFKR